ncbi:MAG: hypothetical protein AAF585_02535 [Verrucomicrobiota bacterium]
MMKRIFWISAAALVNLSVVWADNGSLKSEIVGDWKHEHRQIGVSADTIKTYAADGTYKASSKVSMLGAKSGVDYEGKWEILDGPILRLTVTKTNNKLYVSSDAVYEMKDLKIENGVMTYKHKGKAERETRVKD